MAMTALYWSMSDWTSATPSITLPLHVLRGVELRLLVEVADREARGQASLAV